MVYFVQLVLGKIGDDSVRSIQGDGIFVKFFGFGVIAFHEPEVAIIEVNLREGVIQDEGLGKGIFGCVHVVGIQSCPTKIIPGEG